MASRARVRRDEATSKGEKERVDKINSKKESLRLLLSSEHGSVLLDELKRICYEGEEIADMVNVNQTYYNLGRQSVLLHLQKLIEED